MSGTPKVAVITRTRNRPALLRRAIESVLAQSMPDWLHVIVNDGGDRAHLDAVCSRFEKEYAGRLLLLHQEHSGMQEASNNAIRNSNSIYLVVHDDDDSWHPDFLKETTAFLDKEGQDSVYQGVITMTLRVLESENADGTFTEIERKPYIPLREISLFRLGYENPFPPIAFLYRRTVHERIGLFDPRWDIAADLEFNFRFLQSFEIGVVPRPLALYHWRDQSSSRQNANTVTTQQDRHARFLNELKNHYMRKAESAREVAHALSFQFSAYLIENQWMTAEIRERSIAETGRLQALEAQLQQLRAFNDSTLWPKLTEDILPRLEAILAAAAPVAELRERVAALGEAGAQGLAAQQFLARQLDQLPAIIEAELRRTLAEEIVPRLHSLLHFAAQIGQLRAFNDNELLPKLAAAAEGQAALARQLDQTRQENASALRELREELASLREENRRQWQLGRLRIRWLPGRTPGQRSAEP